MGSRHPVILPAWKRSVALIMALLLMLPSPSLMAITMGQIKAGGGAGGGAGGAGGGRGSAPNLQSAGGASADLTASQARTTLLKSNELLAAVQNAQAAARSAAKAASSATAQGVPNGLKNGWLEPHVVGGGAGIAADGTPNTTSWSGATMSTKAGKPNVQITQNQQNAYLYWNHFNVGPQTIVEFDQSQGGVNAGSWIAFNKVMSATDPSHIFGQIKAQGQVYIQNQNGILFHNGSSVNVRALVASTLPVNENLAGDALKNLSSKGTFNTVDFSRWGKLNNASRENLFTLGDRTAAKTGDVVIEKGAVITAGSTAQPGMAAFVAPNIRNDASATISADKSHMLAGERVRPTASDSGTPEVANPGKVVNGDGNLYANKKSRDDISADNLLESMTPAGNLVLKLDNAGNVTFRPDSWAGAFISSPLFSKSLEITQTSQSAYLGWSRFSVPDGITLNVNQSAGGADVGKWIAFNTVTGEGGTAVSGDLNARGQIYMIDQNGITFEGSSSVNVHSLVASTLPINENLAGNATTSGRGIANNPDYQFLFTALHVDGDSKLNTASFDPVITAKDGKFGDVVVRPGASIFSPADANHTGGLVALIGPNVINGGIISTPNGQTVLGAGLQVGLTPHSEPSLRGMKTYVGALSDESGTVSALSGSAGSTLNDGIIRANQGNITLAGGGVFQNGVLESSTSTGLNGRIDIAAIHDAVLNPKFTSDGLNGSLLLSSESGQVTLGARSLLRILPEWEDTSTKVIGSTLSLNSLITVTGSDVSFGRESILFAPGAVATQGATGLYGENLYSGVVINASGPMTDAGPVKYSSGRIDVAQGAVLDVGGSTGITADSSEYMLQLQLRGPELANSPLQRENKAIRGKTITVDSRITGTYDGKSWVGTPLGDASGYLGLVQRTVGELTTAGGSISLLAGDGVSLAGGSRVNVSGGWVRYAGGTFATTKLLGADGRIYDIAQATPDRIYTAIVKDTPQTYEAPYLSGSSGGSLAIQAPSVSMDGELQGTTVTGFRQLRNGDRPGTPPGASSLSLNLQGQAVFGGGVAFTSRYAPEVLLGSKSPSGDASRTLVIDPGMLAASGFGNLSVVNPNGLVSMEKGSVFNAGLGGTVNLEGANLDLQGSLLAPGGKISLTADLIPMELRQVAPIDPAKHDPDSLLGLYEIKETGERVYQFGSLKGDRITILHSDLTKPNYGLIETVTLDALRPASTGSIVLHGSTLLSTAGLVTSDSIFSSSKLEPNAVTPDGGTISLNGYKVSLGNSILDVSGGVHQTAKGAVTYGNGGVLSLAGGVNGVMTSGSLDTTATLLGYGGPGKRGGSLSLSSLAFAIGHGGVSQGVTLLDPGFFSQGGFSGFSITGTGLKNASDEYVPGVELLPGTTLRPEVATALVGFQDGQAVLTPSLLSAPYRSAPSLEFHATGVVDLGRLPADQLLTRGDVRLDSGSSITLDPGLVVNGGLPAARPGSLVITGQSVAIDGARLSVPGGAISVTADKMPENVDAPTSAKVTVELGAGSVLSTAGTVLYGTDPKGGRTRFGTVLSGGSLSLTGNLLLHSGSLLNVSGASGVLDLYSSESGMTGGGLSPVRVDSSAGSIVLKGIEAFRSDATFSAHAGGPTAEGGSLIVSSGRFYGLTDSKSPMDFTLSIVSRQGATEGLDGIGQSISDAPGIAKGGGLFSATSLTGAGFDNLTLAGNVFFSGDSGSVQINLPGAIKVATKGLLAADTAVTLGASYASLGTPFIAPLGPLDPRRQSVLDPDNLQYFAPPTWGKGDLTVNADLIDLGNLSLSGIGTAKLLAGSGGKNNGTIRGDGSFVMAGDLTMAAGVIYPVSGTTFRVVSFNHDRNGVSLSTGGTLGKIDIKEGTPSSAPLSAGGTMEIYADSIIQAGNLYAPFGKILLGASGTPKDPMSGLAAPSSTSISVTGGIVSVSGLDSLSGKKLTVPFGTSTDGTSWIDLSGTDISATGLPSSLVTITGNSLNLAKGSLIDLRGGGEITANRWVSGLGGTIDYLSKANSYAIVPGYESSFAPTGYGDGGLRIGSRIVLSGEGGLPAGTYTLLPAGYATLPGAYLLTSVSGNAATGKQADGSFLVSGRTINGLNRSSQASAVLQTFRLDPPTELASRVQYDILKADTFFSSLPSSAKTADASSLKVRAGNALALEGAVRGTPGTAGRGAFIDLSGTLDFRIGKGESSAGIVVIDPEVLNGLDAGSLLIGGVRDKTASGFSITSEATSVTVDSKVSLRFPELILTAAPKTHLVKDGESFDSVSGAYEGVEASDLAGSNPDAMLTEGQTLTIPKGDYPDYTVGKGETLAGIATANGVTLAKLIEENTQATVAQGSKLRIPGFTASLSLGSGASVTASGNAPGVSYSVTGDGVLLLASASSATTLSRTGFLPNAASASGRPYNSLYVSGSTFLRGGTVILDSTASGAVNSTATVDASSVAIRSGKIALDGGQGNNAVSGALTIKGALLQGISRADALELTSYSSLNFINGARLGSTDSKTGNALVSSMILRAGSMTGDGTDAVLTAGKLQADNANDSSASPKKPLSGSLYLNANLLKSGEGNLVIRSFRNVYAAVTGAFLGSGKGGIAADGNLSVWTPFVTALGGSDSSLSAAGSLKILQYPGSSSVPTTGLGGAISFTGSSVELGAPLVLKSGSVSVKALSGDLTLSSVIDVSGTVQSFRNEKRYTDAGAISLSADAGNIAFDATSSLDLSARDGGGNAGKLTISSPLGILTPGGSINASAKAGSGGRVNVDLAASEGDIDPLVSFLAPFTASQSYRFRSGDVSLSGAKTHDFRLSADQGSINVTGTIDASGEHGGSIALLAGKSLSLADSALLTVEGNTYDAAGKGGMIDLEAGNSSTAVIASKAPAGSGIFNSGFSVLDLGAAILNLGVKAAPSEGQNGGTLLLKAPQTADARDLQINPLHADIRGSSAITAVGNNRLDAAVSGTAAIDKLPVFGNLPLGLPYLAGQRVVSASNGKVYQLTGNSSIYAKYVTDEVAGDNSVDPADSSVSGAWRAVAYSWDYKDELVDGGKVGFNKGDKVYNSADGLIYTAQQFVLIKDIENPPSPGSSPLWKLEKEDGNLQALALANASSFTEAVASAGNRFAGALQDAVHLQPGEEIVNSKGSLVLNSDWDLSLARYGAQATVLDSFGNRTASATRIDPGLLTLRAAGDVVFRGALSDGFGNSRSSSAGLSPGLYKDPLLPLLDASGTVMAQRSWSYRITAGADLKSADAQSVLGGGVGNVSVGVPYRVPDGYTGDENATTLDALFGFYQPIRTGTGSIAISSSGDVRIWNDFSSIYTAGARVLDPTMGGRFDIPSPDLSYKNENLGYSASGYDVSFSQGGGNVSITAGRDITRLALQLDSGTGGYLYDASGKSSVVAASVTEMPSNWLLRRGAVDPASGLFLEMPKGSELASTAWWVDFSNFFQGVGALGGGNVTMTAARNVANVDAVIPTNFRMPSRDASGNQLKPDVSAAVELGGGNLNVTAGNNIDAGVYYVEKGAGSLIAGGSIVSNQTRDSGLPGGGNSLFGFNSGNEASSPESYLPTTIFQGKGANGGGLFSVKAGGDLLLGPVANPFLMPQSINNGTFYSTYFSTYDPGNRVDVSSLNGNVVLREGAANIISSGVVSPLLQIWMQQEAYASESGNLAYYQPWVRSSELNMAIQTALFTVQPPTLDVSVPGGSITIQGNLNLAPAARGNLSLLASGGISGFAKAGTYNGLDVYGSSVINLSDADPAKVPGTAAPLSRIASLALGDRSNPGSNSDPASGGTIFYTDALGALISETGSYAGSAAQISTKLALHDQNGQLHAGDVNPLTLTALGGGISGMTLFSPKMARISAAEDISDVGFYLQNVAASDISVVSAGRKITLFDPLSLLRSYAALQTEPFTGFPSGDLQISGPGTLEVIAANSIDLGNQTGNPNDITTWNGITSIGNNRNPGLPFQGADLVLGAGIALPSGLGSGSTLKLQEFADEILAGPAADSYLKELRASLTYSGLPTDLVLTKDSLSAGSAALTGEQKALLQTRLFYLVLRDTGRGFNDPNSPGYRSYAAGEKAIAKVFGSDVTSGSVTAWSRDIRTKNGGDISILTPGGGVKLASTQPPNLTTTPGIVTEHGGGIGIFTKGNVDLGIGRIFTLRGGDILIWSDKGNIAAGSSAKTVASAPPARVLFDPQSGDVVTDLAGLSTGGGIGVLDTVAGIPPGNVDLLAPSGFIDAGDAGIRSSGNLNLAALAILNADNIMVGGLSVGAPPPAAPAAAAPAAAAPAPAAAPPAASTAAAANNAAADAASKKSQTTAQADQTPSIFSIDILGYGGGEGEEEEKVRKAASLGDAPVQASL